MVGEAGCVSGRFGLDLFHWGFASSAGWLSGLLLLVPLPVSGLAWVSGLLLLAPLAVAGLAWVGGATSASSHTFLCSVTNLARLAREVMLFSILHGIYF